MNKISTVEVTGVRGVTCHAGGSPCKPLYVSLSAQGDGVTGVYLLFFELICVCIKRAFYIYTNLQIGLSKKRGSPRHLLPKPSEPLGLQATQKPQHLPNWI